MRRVFVVPVPLLLFFILGLTSHVDSTCLRQPHFSQSVALKSPGDNGYQIHLNGNPDRYVPGSSYVLSIKGGRNHQGYLQKFKGFVLTVEASHPQSDIFHDTDGSDSPVRVGTFMLYSDELTQYHGECINTIKESDLSDKSEIQVMWQAPPKGSGCVTFRAMVLVDKDTWFADDEGLSKKICEITPEYLRGTEDVESNTLECCSCDEAKYTMVFEGLWSSSTHPKDFPTNLWLTHFSDVIGATHRTNFSFWGEGQIASDGLRQVAEWGSARNLEAELRSKARNLKTLIKAAGLWHPHVNENTTATFKVDKQKHLLSVVSMFGPTPDWIVGVSGLNLCQRDCTWVENKVIDLYPYDAGTDSGVSYMSPNEPTIPRERISRITPLYPEDPRAPFYDPQGKPMKPLAKLYLKLDYVTPKQCHEDVDGTVDLPPVVDLTENTEDTRRPECNVTDYTPWSPCSVTCGKGIRMRTRNYLMPQKAQMLGCDRQLVSKEMCVADQPSCSEGPFQYPSPFQYLPDSDEVEDTEAFCETSPFGEWSECSTTCGVGVAMRTRRFLDRWGRKKCPHVSLVEKRECIEPPCPSPSPGINMDSRCTTSEWTDWSPCSATCGTGLRYRSRQVLVGGELKDICAGRVELNQQRICTLQADCSVDRTSAKQICMLEPDSGPCRGFFERWYFDPREKQCVTFPFGGCRGNRNNFKLESECNEACGTIRDELILAESELRRGGGGDGSFSSLSSFYRPNNGTRIDCVVDDWTDWTPCSVSCGVGKSVKMRMVKVQPQNGGRPCPKRLLKKRVCQGPPC
ncbi:f-spondin, putative [Pediculus humanus corporis]|uniref:Spondin-1 n=1 Tax=Pediculus humanus subsp. corporis TaxID=121224 RepID=E0W462_PEDHC|nr:f-spondin, putative [Pediculus humanus corporis]EEB20418.1 f-spondin, putative [Pediculus humanus corporis]